MNRFDELYEEITEKKTTFNSEGQRQIKDIEKTLKELGDSIGTATITVKRDDYIARDTLTVKINGKLVIDTSGSYDLVKAMKKIITKAKKMARDKNE